MTEHKGPLLITEVGRLGAMGLCDLRCPLNVSDEILPRGGKTLIGLGFGTAFEQCCHNTLGGDLFAPTVEDLLLKLGDQGIRLVADRDGELRHGRSTSLLSVALKT
ncbi:MAG: hypothetical protein VKM17_07495 [Cyanobacteriota bacterium]|nr:hypothetical protein [Cyanobacteriota bacterium]